MIVTLIFALALVLAVMVVVFLIQETRALHKKLRAEQMRGDAAFDDAHRSRARMNRAEEQRSRAVLGYGELLEHVQEIAVHLENNHQPFLANRLRRLVDDRLGALRRIG